MDGGEIERARPSWAVRFSLTMLALNPGISILLSWLARIVVFIAVLRAPEVVASWLS